jgi:T-complex protein 1 subunit delta
VQGKAKIMVLRDIERDEIEFVSKALGCMPVAHVDHMRPDKLGAAELVQEVSVGSGKMVRVTGAAPPSAATGSAARTACVLLRGSNKLVLEESERSLHDALCVTRCLVQQPFMLPGGSAPEMEAAHALAAWANTLGGMESYAVREFAEALEVVPYTLSENAGLNPIHIVSQLRSLHAQGQAAMGINVKKGTVTNMREQGVVQPLLVTKSAFELATECVRMILKIDDIVPIR